MGFYMDKLQRGLAKLKEIDAKKFEKIAKGETDSEEDGKLFTAISQILAYQANLATGKYKLKKLNYGDSGLKILNYLFFLRWPASNFYFMCIQVFLLNIL